MLVGVVCQCRLWALGIAALLGPRGFDDCNRWTLGDKPDIVHLKGKLYIYRTWSSLIMQLECPVHCTT